MKKRSKRFDWHENYKEIKIIVQRTLPYNVSLMRVILVFEHKGLYSG